MNAHAIEGRRMGKVKRCSETGLMIPECRLAAKVESVERAVKDLQREIAEYERPRVKSAAELASKVAGREVTREELREQGAKRRDEFYERFPSARRWATH